MIKFNETYSINDGQDSIVFTEGKANSISGKYNSGTLTGNLDGNLLKATYHNQKNNSAGLIEFEFNENGFIAKWKQGLEEGPMRGKWNGNIVFNSNPENKTVEILIIKEIKIGEQVWMGANLMVDTFRNGDPIAQAKTNDEWQKAVDNEQPAWCYYNNDPTLGVKYGKLYNWYAVIDPRLLAPDGYHVPTDDEWNKLTSFLEIDEDVEDPEDSMTGIMLKAKESWDEGGNGDNTSEFSGLPGGCRNLDGSFSQLGREGSWWSKTEYGGITLAYDFDGILSNSINPGFGLSVRCLRD